MADSDLDELDARMIKALHETPRAGVMELARQLDVARGTAQARLDKLQQRGVITGFGPDIAVDKIGFPVTAFITLEITQGQLAEVVAHLESIPEVLEAHTMTGPGDLLCRVVARSNADLQEVLSRVLSVGSIGRTATQIALTERISHRVLPLIASEFG